MRALIITADEGGFSAAARKMGTSKVLVSRSIAKLEAHLNVRLLHRTTRTLSLTTIGQNYYQQAKPLIDELFNLNNSIQEYSNKPTGTLRVLAPHSLAEMYLMPIICNFKHKYPNIHIDMRLNHQVLDLVSEGFDLAIRTGKLADSNLIARKIAEYDIVTCVSPAYIEQHGLPDTPDGLLNYAIVIDTILSPDNTWTFEKGGKINKVKLEGKFRVDSAQAVREALLLGYGIAQAPEFAVANDLASGKLAQIFKDFNIKKRKAYVVYPHREYLPFKVTLFIEELKNELIAK